MSSLAELLEPEIVHTVVCGTGRFTVDENETVTQYDHTGAVVGIFTASNTPTLRAWIVERSPPNERRGRIPSPASREQLADALT